MVSLLRKASDLFITIPLAITNHSGCVEVCDQTGVLTQHTDQLPAR